MIIEQPLTELSTFQAYLDELFAKLDPADVLYKLRLKAWERFLELGLPTRKNEVFRYIRLRHFFGQTYTTAAAPVAISAQEIAPFVLPECAESLLVFVNGHFSPELSQMQALPKRLVISSLNAAMRTYSTFLNNQWTRALKEETDAFALLNQALHQDGLFLYLPPKTLIEKPIQILNVIAAADTVSFLMPRIQVFVGAQSQLQIVSNSAQLNSASSYALNLTADIAIEEDAHVQYLQPLCGVSDSTWQFDALRATLKRNSTLKTVAVTDGAGTIRHDYRVSLLGENCEAQLNGVSMLSGKKEAHCHILMDHQAPNCRSMQLFKNVLNDFSHASFEGKIMVRQAAQKTEAFQLNNNLLLSERAQADSKPNLEIFADDVKASHGATFGQLDQEQIFYMKTRGFSDANAKNLLVNGFCQEIISMIPIASLREALGQRAKNYLN